MQVVYGNYGCPANGVRWTTSINTTLVDNVPTTITSLVNLEGMIEGTGQSDVAAKCAAMQRAFLTPYRDLEIRGDNGQVLEAIRSGGSLTGVVCVSGPNYPDGQFGDFGTYRKFTATFQAVYQAEQGKPLILSYTQTLETSGGFPVVVFQPSVTGKPVKVQTSPATTFKARQSGSAVGLISYPFIPPPIFGAGNLVANPTISRSTPRRNGRGLTEWAVAWSYEFESVNPLNGLPGLPP